MTSPLIGQERERAEQVRAALRQLLDEVMAAGFGTATDYNWPKAIADAKAALEGENSSAEQHIVVAESKDRA